MTLRQHVSQREQSTDATTGSAQQTLCCAAWRQADRSGICAARAAQEAGMFRLTFPRSKFLPRVFVFQRTCSRQLPFHNMFQKGTYS